MIGSISSSASSIANLYALQGQSQAAKGTGNGKAVVGQNSANSLSGNQKRSPEEERVIAELQQTDRKVHAHEAAHMAAGSGLTSGASFSYRTGPDNKQYAVAGEVGVNTSEGRTPQETLQRARQIRAAALAPADPSPQDYKVAQSANSMAQKASAEIFAAEAEKNRGGSEKNKSENNGTGQGGLGDLSASSPRSAQTERALQAYQGREGLSGFSLSPPSVSAVTDPLFRATA